MHQGKKTALALAVAASIGAGVAEAAQVAAYMPVTTAGVNNFTMLTPGGDMQGGTNDVFFSWTGTIFTSSSDYTGPGSVSNATLSSNQKFSGSLWTAHDVQIFGPGTYTFNTATGGGNPEAGTQTMTVGANQLGAHMLFDWNNNNNIDVSIVWNTNTTFGSCNQSAGGAPGGPANCIFTGADNGPASPGTAPDPDGAANTMSTVWMLASTDDDGNGILGIPMAAGGPFPGFNASFNLTGTLTPVPIPAAVWLFGSGLLGLVGIARRRKVSV